MAKSRLSELEQAAAPKKRNDAYVMMLFITLLALGLGCGLMYADWDEYSKQSPPKEVIPALNKNERRAALPLMAIAPILFISGVVFSYFIVLPPAVHFLQGYNAEHFDVLVQAKSYYTFEIITMLAIGLAFQLPLGLLALHRIGVINGRTLTRHWRYALVIIALVAAAMPGADPVTTALETAPLVIL